MKKQMKILINGINGGMGQNILRAAQASPAIRSWPASTAWPKL